VTDTAAPKPRVHGGLRQSKTKDKSISLDAQRKTIAQWAQKNGYAKPTFSYDPSTSGGKSPFDRKELGPWLRDPDKIASWDILAVTRLDRACRSVLDYLKLAEWCERRGKRLAVLDDPTLDTSTPQGKAMATMRAVFAELERELAKSRNKERYDYLVDEGHWPGGRLNYGWRYDRSERALVPDEGGTADVLRTMADMAIAGKSQGQIAVWLNGGNGTICHLTLIRRQWKQDTVRQVLRHEATQELLGDAKAAQLRAALRDREQTRGERTNGHMLLRVAFCGTCGGPLYCAVKRDRPSGGYYRCLTCGTATAMDKLEAAVEREVLSLAGDRELTGRVLVPGDDHQAAIHALEHDVDALERITGTELVVHAKKAEIEHLKKLPYDPDHYDRVPLGVTVATHWATLGSAAERGGFLREQEVKATVGRNGRVLAIDVDPGLLAAPAGEFVNETDLAEKIPAPGISPSALPPPTLPDLPE
jgi:site-specific DNA recombinase